MAICQRCHEYWSLYHSNKDCEIVELRALNAELLTNLQALLLAYPGDKISARCRHCDQYKEHDEGCPIGQAEAVIDKAKGDTDDEANEHQLKLLRLFQEAGKPVFVILDDGEPNHDPA